MKKFEMPKFEVIGLTKDLAYAGASDKGANFEFAPKTTYGVGDGNKFTKGQIMAALEVEDNNALNASA